VHVHVVIIIRQRIARSQLLPPMWPPPLPAALLDLALGLSSLLRRSSCLDFEACGDQQQDLCSNQPGALGGACFGPQQCTAGELRSAAASLVGFEGQGFHCSLERWKAAVQGLGSLHGQQPGLRRPWGLLDRYLQAV
jgi:hypothetical protein